MRLTQNFSADRTSQSVSALTADGRQLQHSHSASHPPILDPPPSTMSSPLTTRNCSDIVSASAATSMTPTEGQVTLITTLQRCSDSLYLIVSHRCFTVVLSLLPGDSSRVWLDRSAVAWHQGEWKMAWARQHLVSARSAGPRRYEESDRVHHL